MKKTITKYIKIDNIVFPVTYIDDLVIIDYPELAEKNTDRIRIRKLLKKYSDLIKNEK